jgi:hypothetical protein
MIKRCVSSFLFLFAFGLFAQEITTTPGDLDALLEAYKGENLYLPANPSVRLEPEVVVSPFDGWDRTDMYLRSEKIQFRTVVLDNWQNLRVKDGSGYSILFVNRYAPEVKFGLSLYDRKVIPSGFNEESMLGLLAGLRATYSKQKLDFSATPQRFHSSGYFSSLLGSPAFMTDIQFLKSSDREVILRNISYYFTAENFLIVASIEGSRDLVALNKGTLERFLYSLSVYKPE